MNYRLRQAGTLIVLLLFYIIFLVSGCVSFDIETYKPETDSDAPQLSETQDAETATRASFVTRRFTNDSNNSVVVIERGSTEERALGIDYSFDEALWTNITETILKNTKSPFEYTGAMIGPNLFEASNWTANEAAIANGNVSLTRNGALGLIANTANGVPTNIIINGKLYQTVELEAGTYSFNATVYELSRTSSDVIYKEYVAAALGNTLPDTENVEIEALGFVLAPYDISAPNPPTIPSKTILPVEFTLSRRSTVSLGFVATFDNPAGNYNYRSFYQKVDLWKLK